MVMQMIRFKLGELLEKKSFQEGRRIQVQELAAATGINRTTLSKILNQKGYVTGTDNLDKLCTYFDCDLAEVAEHLPDA